MEILSVISHTKIKLMSEELPDVKNSGNEITTL